MNLEQKQAFYTVIKKALIRRYGIDKISSVDTNKVIDIIQQYIETNNEIPTVDEILTAMALQMNSGVSPVHTIAELNQAIEDYLVANPQGSMTDEEFSSKVTQYIIDNNIVPTVDEVQTAMNLEVHNDQTALNFTTDQVRAIVQDYLDSNPLQQRSVADVQTIITDYINTHNQIPTIDEILNSMNLAVHNNQTALNFTTDQVRDIVRQYLVDNPPSQRSEDDVRTIITDYINTHNEVPTVDEILNSMALNETPNHNISVFNVRTPMIKTFDDISEAIINKITSVNITLPVPPSKDIRYVYNRTIPRYAKTWSPTIETPLTISAINNLQYVIGLNKLLLAKADKLTYIDLTDNSAIDYAITSDYSTVTIDGNRVFTKSGQDVKIYDLVNSSYQLFQTFNSDTSDFKIISDSVGSMFVLGKINTATVETYKLNRTTGLFELIHTTSLTTTIKDFDFTFDNNRLVVLNTDNKIDIYNYDTNNGWETTSPISTTIKDANGIATAFDIPASSTGINVLLDLSRLWIKDPANDKIYMFYKDDVDTYNLEIELNDFDTVEYVTTTPDLKYIWCSNGIDTVNRYDATDYTEN